MLIKYLKGQLVERSIAIVPKVPCIDGDIAFEARADGILLGTILKQLSEEKMQIVINFGRALYRQQYDEKFIKEQAQINKDFRSDLLESISVNIWDDYLDGSDTYAYVESSVIPVDYEKEVLGFLMTELARYLDHDVTMELVYYKSADKYPSLIGSEHEYSLYQRWQLNFKNLSHERLESLVEILEDASIKHDDIKVDIYSES